MDMDELSDLELLSSALQDATAAYHLGVIVGPVVDEVALRRAERQARRQDEARMLLLTIPGGEAA